MILSGWIDGLAMMNRLEGCGIGYDASRGEENGVLLEMLACVAGTWSPCAMTGLATCMRAQEVSTRLGKSDHPRGAEVHFDYSNVTYFQELYTDG